MTRQVVIIEGKPVKLHRVWTARHYRPTLVGALCAGVYAGGLRWAENQLGIEVPVWLVAVTGQVALFFGVACARLMWFDL